MWPRQWLAHGQLAAASILSLLVGLRRLIR
jgi:hypothetical protein